MWESRVAAEESATWDLEVSLISEAHAPLCEESLRCNPPMPGIYTVLAVTRLTTRSGCCSRPAVQGKGKGP